MAGFCSTESSANTELMNRISAAKDAADLIDIAAEYRVEGDALVAFKAKAERASNSTVRGWVEIYWCSAEGSELDAYAKMKGRGELKDQTLLLQTMKWPSG